MGEGGVGNRGVVHAAELAIKVTVLYSIGELKHVVVGLADPGGLYLLLDHVETDLAENKLWVDF